jgi:hypothetical protein
VLVIEEETSDEQTAATVQHAGVRKLWLVILLMIAAASIAIRLLQHYQFHNSALLYVGIPFLISLSITVFRPPSSKLKWWHAYRDHSYIALIVFLSSSVVLFEGFVCVVFFMPIYFLVVSVAFLINWFLHSRQLRRSKTFASVLPILVLALSLEGTSDTLSMSRNSQVTVTKVVELSPADVMKNLSRPFSLQKERNWLISIFPMPYKIEAGSLKTGDVHRVYTRYHRWFATNTHEGELHLKIADVEPYRVATKFIHDSTFFASYLTATGTEIHLREISPRETEITLRIDYQRKLDPAWYFHPLQQYGVTQMAEFLIDEVMIRDE